MLEFLLRFAWKECVSRNLVSSGREEFVSMIAERDHKDASIGHPTGTCPLFLLMRFEVWGEKRA